MPRRVLFLLVVFISVNLAISVVHAGNFTLIDYGKCDGVHIIKNCVNG